MGYNAFQTEKGYLFLLNNRINETSSLYVGISYIIKSVIIILSSLI